MVHSYYLCDLTNVKGLGKKFYGLLKEFIENQEKYRLFRPKYIDRKLLVLNVREQLFIMSIAKKGKALSV
jgi:hypothetical protein